MHSFTFSILLLFFLSTKFCLTAAKCLVSSLKWRVVVLHGASWEMGSLWHGICYHLGLRSTWKVVGATWRCAVRHALLVVLSPPFFITLMLGDTHVKDRG